MTNYPLIVINHGVFLVVNYANELDKNDGRRQNNKQFDEMITTKTKHFTPQIRCLDQIRKCDIEVKTVYSFASCQIDKAFDKIDFYVAAKALAWK